MRKKIIILSIAIGLVCTAAIGNAVAYFSESSEVKNIITTNSLGVGIVEDSNQTISINDSQIVPGIEIDKPVCIENTDKETEYVKVTVTKYWAEIDTQDCTLRKEDSDASVIDLITKNKEDWIILSDEIIDDENNETLILFYKEPIKSGEKTSNVFDLVKISPEIDNSYTHSSIQINLLVEAVQATNGKSAIEGEWGMEVKFDDNGIIEEVIY